MLTTINEFKKILERKTDFNPTFEITDPAVKAGDDSNETRPSRMANPLTLAANDTKNGNEKGFDYVYNASDSKEHYTINMFELYNAKSRNGHGSIYIQDHLSDMLKDKYGEVNGEKAFQATLNIPNHGAFYQVGMKLLAEKSLMLSLLHPYLKAKNQVVGDYWTLSYFWLWKQMMKYLGKDVDKAISTGQAKKDKIEADKQAEAERLRLEKEAADKARADKKAEIQAKLDLLKDKFTQKDVDRIKSIVDKSEFSTSDPRLQQSKKRNFVYTMINSIKDDSKLASRGFAAKSIGEDAIATMFFDEWISKNR